MIEAKMPLRVIAEALAGAGKNNEEWPTAEPNTNQTFD